MQPPSLPVHDQCGITGADGFVRNSAASGDTDIVDAFADNAIADSDDNAVVAAAAAAVRRKRRKKKPKRLKRSDGEDEDAL